MSVATANSPVEPMASLPTPAPTRSAMPLARAISDLNLAATSTAVACASLFVEYTLRGWERRELADGATWITGELVADAVRLTGFPDPGVRWVDADDLALLRVRLVLLDSGIICEVADRHTQLPAPSEHFQTVCTRWNAYLTQVGRVIWGEVELSARKELTEHGLPKRAASPVPPAAQPDRYDIDPELLRRVRDGIGKL